MCGDLGMLRTVENYVQFNPFCIHRCTTIRFNFTTVKYKLYFSIKQQQNMHKYKYTLIIMKPCSTTHNKCEWSIQWVLFSAHGAVFVDTDVGIRKRCIFITFIVKFIFKKHRNATKAMREPVAITPTEHHLAKSIVWNDSVSWWKYSNTYNRLDIKTY